jgi:alkylhydroperoxidase/carboxymuconolactone decarboxylase family protein YurZ
MKAKKRPMRLLAEFFPEFAAQLDGMDSLYAAKRMIDEKTYRFICFSLPINPRSKPSVLKHFKGALEAGATVKERAYILALVMREAAGADDCWTRDVIGDCKEIVAGNIKSECEK